MECPLCIDTIKKSVTCCGCNYTTCVPCAEKYLLLQPIGAHCMNPDCAIKWTTKFLLTMFSKTWVTKTYRSHLKKISLERERAKLPETLAQIPRYKKEKEQKKEIEKLTILLTQTKKRAKQFQTKIFQLQHQQPNTTKATIIPHFICPCPTGGCKGLVDSKFYCNLCENSICRRCRIPLKEEEKHECDEEVIETVKLLRGDTKPCPKCATPIYKISGCDQMWCTQCRTAFSWKTGKIVTGIIHNPHAIRWQRENGDLLRANGDIPCGGLIRMYNLSMLPRVHYNKLYNIHRRIAELPADYGGLLTLNTPNRDFESLRKDLVLKDITEEEFKQKIFLRERLNARKEENHRILSTLQTLAIERFRDVAQTCTEINHRTDLCGQGKDEAYDVVVKNFTNEMGKIREFINDAFKEELPPLRTPRPYIIPSDWGYIRQRVAPTKIRRRKK